MTDKQPVRGEMPLPAARLVTGVFALLGFTLLSEARDIRVAVVSDGPVSRQVFSVEAIEREIANVAGPGSRILLPPDKRFTGDWSLEGAARVFDRALADRDVDLVIAMGVLTSQHASRLKVLSKPVIAALVIDPILQEFPLVEGRSGRRNFTYVADFQSVAQEVRSFHEIVGFRHMVAVVDASLLEALPRIAVKASEAATELNVRISLATATDDVAEVLAKLPEGIDAVYVTPLRFNEAQQRELAQALIARRLPSFSVV